MFTDTSFKKYTIGENNISVGNVEVNHELLEAENFIRPFIRMSEGIEIIKLGNRDYEKLDQLIISSMNDYYNRLMGQTSSTEKYKMLNTYRRLYSMWQELYNHKRSQNFTEMDKVYDLFSYEFYLLGYPN